MIRVRARLRNGRDGAVDMGVARVEVEVGATARALDVGVRGRDVQRRGRRAEALAAEAARVVVAARQVVPGDGEEGTAQHRTGGGAHLVRVRVRVRTRARVRVKVTDLASWP